MTLGNTAGSVNASLLTNGSFTFSNAVTVASGSSGNTLTLGGGSGNSSTFSGLITLNNAVTLSQANASGTLYVSGGIAAGGNAINLVGTGRSSLTPARSVGPARIVQRWHHGHCKPERRQSVISWIGSDKQHGISEFK